MTIDDHSHPDNTVSLAFLKRAEPLCSAFEDAWQKGERPSIHDYLLGGANAEVEWLIEHLLQIEFECRAKLNETPNIADYRDRFPNHQALVDSLVQEFSATRVSLEVIIGPHKGRKFTFNKHDQFLVGRTVPHSHFRLPLADPYFSRMHLMIEVNPPHCHLIDLCSLNGTQVNGERVDSRRLEDGDLVHCGQTTMLVSLEGLDTANPSQPAVEATGTPHEGAPPDDDDPQSIAGYGVVRRLGQGGMGIVYLVRRPSDGAEFAIKTIRPSMTVTDRETERFRREANILCSLQHPNIVSFRQLGLDRGLFYIVMDYVPGTNLSQRISQSGPMTLGPSIDMTRQVLDALDFAHTQGFVHRDVKPANILMTDDGACSLADFGLARVYHESRMSGITVLGEVGGTIPFMPPEQIKDYRRARPAADQYSAAATLYYALTGSFVYDFDSGRQNEQLMQVLLKRPIPITQRRADIPPAVAVVIHRALEKQPEDRFSSVAEFRSRLIDAARNDGGM